ncbi:unnamed protein product [Prorocentrum cordatum]|uniref:J domain-containing protein n=1 Tax=Prorocentrum cordatum TaxID=2364126 RepID=A0ABN9VL32_9DINO|nr:unnamed protein product [Polarella glacialis]
MAKSSPAMSRQPPCGEQGPAGGPAAAAAGRIGRLPGPPGGATRGRAQRRRLGPWRWRPRRHRRLRLRQGTAACREVPARAGGAPRLLLRGRPRAAGLRQGSRGREDEGHGLQAAGRRGELRDQQTCVSTCLRTPRAKFSGGRWDPLTTPLPQRRPRRRRWRRPRRAPRARWCGGGGPVPLWEVRADVLELAYEALASSKASERELEASKEAARILALKKSRFASTAAWGFSLLDITARDKASVHRGYRTLMRKLHPDKAGCVQGVLEAAELAREAKEACERHTSTESLPPMPRGLRFERKCSDPGKRTFLLHWSPFSATEVACVRRYIVQVFDPAYGRALKVADLEPDYSEELGRYVSVEEITTYELSEEVLSKMPKVWSEPVVKVTVAAANQAGQSAFASINVPLRAAPASVLPARPASRPPGPAWRPPSPQRCPGGAASPDASGGEDGWPTSSSSGSFARFTKLGISALGWSRRRSLLW